MRKFARMMAMITAGACGTPSPKTDASVDDFGIGEFDAGQSAAGQIIVNGEVFTELSAVAFYVSYDPYRPRVVVVSHPNASCDNPPAFGDDIGGLDFLHDPDADIGYYGVVQAVLDDPDHDAAADPEGVSWRADTFDDVAAGAFQYQMLDGGHSAGIDADLADDLRTAIDRAALPMVRGRLAGRLGDGSVGDGELYMGREITELTFDVRMNAEVCNEPEL